MISIGQEYIYLQQGINKVNDLTLYPICYI